MKTAFGKNYELKTTYLEDFNKADKLGVQAVQDLFDKVFDDSKNNCECITELAMIVNEKTEFYCDEETLDLCGLYGRLSTKINDWCMNNLQDEDLVYYLTTPNKHLHYINLLVWGILKKD